jgi:MFS family permease
MRDREEGVARHFAPRGGSDWRLKGVVLLSSVPLALAFSTVAPILPKMSRELAHTPADQYLVKMMLGVVGIAMVVGAPLAGLLADKVSRRLILAVAGVVFTVAGAAPFVLGSLPLILVTRLLMGLAAQTAYIVGAALVAEAFEDVERARWMGICTTVAIASGMVAMLVAGTLGDAGWRWPFLTYLVGAPITAFGWFALHDETAPPAAVRPHRVAPSRAFPVEFAGLGLLIGFMIYAPSIYLPFHLTALGAMRSSLIGSTLTLSMVASAFASSQFGLARRWLSSRAAFGCSFAAVALGVGVIAVTRSYPVVLVGLFVMGLGSGWLTPNLMASAAGAADEGRQGRALGVVKAAYSLAPAVGVTLLEPVARWVGPQGVLLLTAVLAAAAWLATLGAGLQSPRRWRPASGASLD